MVFICYCSDFNNNILHGMNFLKDSNGDSSSKRLGFVSTLVTAIIATIATLVFLLYKQRFDLAIDLVNSLWLSVFGLCGVVASEFFAKK